MKEAFLYVVSDILGEVKAQAKLCTYKVRTHVDILSIISEMKILEQ